LRLAGVEVMDPFRLTVVLIFCAFLSSCKPTHPTNSQGRVEIPQPTPTVIPVSDGFDYPFGTDRYPKHHKHEVGWYNAQDFGANNHLGEDWNRTTGGDTDCGLPVYAASNGTIVYADEAGTGWGKVVIVRHRLQDGTLVETLYGHFQSFVKTSGQVTRRERIGSIGDGGGAYQCHLHFELRFSNCPAWGQPGPGYSNNRTGWTDPSSFVDANRSLRR
jgi:murein DD-endopeptidase MepM/ murein hydrolase activator NlpD